MASTYLTRTQGTPTNVDKGTMSVWLKRGTLNKNNEYIIQNYVDGSNYGYIRWKSDNELQIYSAGINDEKRTEMVFRDTSAWYHIVVRVDTSQSSSNDRVRLYVNGEQITAFNPNTNGSQNADYDLFKSGGTMRIGYVSSGTATYFDGCLSHFHYCDGQSYAPTEFGETDSTTGEWKIKTSPSVSYGSQGFFILKDGNSVTDQSGNSNNFTVGGGTLTKTEDCPSNVFATFNPLDNYYGGGSTSNGNTTYTSGSTNKAPISATLGASSGKYYWEVKFVSDTGGYAMIGVASSQTTADNELGHNSTDYAYVSGTGQYRNNDGYTSYGNTYSTGDIIGVALDLDNNALYFSKNGTWQNSGDPTSGASKTGAISITAPSSTNYGVYLPAVSDFGSNTIVVNGNFGNGYFGTTAVASAGTNASNNGIFEYDVPTGFTALSTKGLNL
jgi:hypothetical protein